MAAPKLRVVADPSRGPLGAEVVVEVMLLRLLPDSRLAFRVERRTMVDGDREPDLLALATSGVRGREEVGTVCHSTSWRWEDGRVVLTYAVAPDPRTDLAAEALGAPAVLTSGDPLRPSPTHLHDHHVAAHAVRHLAFLAATDPTFESARATAHALWAAIEATGAATTVATYDQVHGPATGARTAGEPA